MKEPKLKYKINVDDLRQVLKLPIIPGMLKKGDVVELIDEKAGINRKCKVEKIENIDNNPYYKKVHFLPSPFEIAVIPTNKMK